MAEPLFSTKDPQGREVTLSEICYYSHILIEHPDIDDVSEIERGIRQAEWITRDVVDENRLIYYRTYRRQPQRLMIKIVTDNGEVVTAYRVIRMKRSEVVLWQR